VGLAHVKHMYSLDLLRDSLASICSSHTSCHHVCVYVYAIIENILQMQST
jgi:hypothetical protein